MAAPESRFVQTAKCLIEFYEVNLGTSEAPPVILLHGWPDTNRAWLPPLDLLLKSKVRAPNFPTRFIAPNLRGTGQSKLEPGVPRSGQQAALAFDLLAFLDALKIPRAFLVGMDWGGRAACIVSAMAPERVVGLCSMGSGYNLQIGIRTSMDIHKKPVLFSVEQEKRWWYQYYLHSERGANALRNRNTRKAFIGQSWKDWSPNWKFSPEFLDAANQMWDDPDWAAITVQSYRHRHGSVAGDPELEWIEDFLAPGPPIRVPTIVLHGEADGVDPYDPAREPLFAGDIKPSDRAYGEAARVKPSAFLIDKFGAGTVPFEKRVVFGAGHFIPEEAPNEVLQAIQWLLEVVGRTKGKL